MSRQHFGTDGVRGVVGETLTHELVTRLGRAAVLAVGIASAGATAVLGGVLPTAAVALGALDLGAAITASHNPPAYNGVKIFNGDGSKLSDAQEGGIEALLDRGLQA